MDVHHRLSVGYHRPVPSAMAGRHDLDSRFHSHLQTGSSGAVEILIITDSEQACHMEE